MYQHFAALYGFEIAVRLRGCGALKTNILGGDSLLSAFKRAILHDFIQHKASLGVDTFIQAFASGSQEAMTAAKCIAQFIAPQI